VYVSEKKLHVPLRPVAVTPLKVGAVVARVTLMCRKCPHKDLPPLTRRCSQKAWRRHREATDTRNPCPGNAHALTSATALHQTTLLRGDTHRRRGSMRARLFADICFGSRHAGQTKQCNLALGEWLR
jgi:hypothetical protein